MSNKTKHTAALSALAVAVMSASVNADVNPLIISEYVEGSGHDKAIELFNSGSASVDLANYQLVKYTNGDKDRSISLKLSGTLQPGATYVVVNSQATDVLKAKAQLINGSVTSFSGDDPIALQDASGTTIDLVGKFGETNFGKDKTLSRKAGSQASASYNPEQWNVLGKDTINGLGVAPGESVTPPDPGPNPNPNPSFGGCDAGDLSRISMIQGNAEDFEGLKYNTPPELNNTHTIKGIVTAVFDDSNSFFMQQVPNSDDKTGASLGIEVTGAYNTPAVGDTVAVKGVVKDGYGMTQLTAVGDDFETCQVDKVDIESLITEAPMPQDADLEEYEGMLVKLLPKAGDDGFYVSNTFKLNRYGEMAIASGQPLYKPTNIYPAHSEEANNEQGYNGAKPGLKLMTVMIPRIQELLVISLI